MEQRLYQVTQNTFTNITIVPVNNVSNAIAYAMHGKQPQRQAEFYNPYTNYNVGSISNAPLACTNCSSSDFNLLTTYTFNLTYSGIRQLSGQPGYASVSSDLMRMFNQTKALDMKGYSYGAANLAFLTYLDSFYFNSRAATVQSGLVSIHNAQSNCASLNAPQFTRQNYEYVIGGELRQSWGTNLMNNALVTYNTTNLDTDEVLQYMYSVGEANAWCSAAKEMYSIAQQIGGTPVNFSSSIALIAASRINATSSYAGVDTYQQSAAQLYNDSNFAAAIFATDYVSSFGAQAMPQTTQQLLNASSSLAANSTYGVWSTQFANEAEFYINKAQVAGIANQSQAQGYAAQAYSTALLASSLSNDTRLIYSSMNNISATSSVNQTTQLVTTLKSINSELFGIFAAIIVLLAVVASLLVFAVAAHMHRHNIAQKEAHGNAQQQVPQKAVQQRPARRTRKNAKR